VPAANQVDGRDILPELAGERAPQERVLFWMPGQSLAARAGDYKLFQWPQPAEPVLFNLGETLVEERNVAGEHPAEYQRLRTAWETWRAALPEPATARILAAHQQQE